MVGEAHEPNSDDGPLDGITVLDASRVLVGPFCTMQLGDLGADVIKVERPGEGDQTRGWHPPTYGKSGESTYYLSVNRNKRSVTLDLGTEGGQEVFRRLAREADVLVENFRVGTLERWGLGYDSLSEENPALIYAKLSGYGEWGPKRDEPAYDLAIQAEGGFMSITGTEDGEPVRVGVAIADIGAGMYATQAILAALFQREVGSGDGQKIDVSLLDGQVAWLTYMATSYFATGEAPGRMGSKHPNIVPYQAFEVANGYVVVAAASEPIWRRLCGALDREGLAEDDRFATNADRVANREALEGILEPIFGTYTVDDLVDHLADHDVPATPVNDLERVFDSPQVEARGMRQTVPHPTAGSIDLPGVPIHFSDASTGVRRHPPLLGEHTEEVLRELGYSDEVIARFREEGVV
jgi:crotonobetainyl-CoA:carnitine CoA-transferase CaiB-like acyl-CoA transferase